MTKNYENFYFAPNRFKTCFFDCRAQKDTPSAIFVETSILVHERLGVEYQRAFKSWHFSFGLVIL